MPGFVIHLAEAKMLYDRLYKDVIKEEDLKYYYFGAILPDCVPREMKKFSHFWLEDTHNAFFRVPDMDDFNRKYKKYLNENDPLVIGLKIHLELDYYFYTEYWPKILVPCDKAGNYMNSWRDDLFVKIIHTGKVYTRDEFFSAEILYGDYSRLNDELLSKYKPMVPNMKDVEVLKEKSVLFKEGGDNIDVRLLLEMVEKFLTEKEEDKDLKVYDKEEIIQYLNDVVRRY